MTDFTSRIASRVLGRDLLRSLDQPKDPRVVAGPWQNPTMRGAFVLAEVARVFGVLCLAIKVAPEDGG